MEEDIEILKDTLKRMKQNNFIIQYKDLYISDSHILTMEQALNRLEQLEKELEPIRELGIPVKTVVAELNRLEDLEDDREQLKIRIKELENEQEQEHKVENRIIEILDEKYIPKSVIREKIEEIEKKICELESKELWNEPVDTIMNNRLVNYYNALKELLGDE